MTARRAGGRPGAGGVMRTIGGMFVAPAETVPSEGGGRGRVPAVAVVCAAGDAVTVGAALGLAIVRERRGACVLVAAWTGAGPEPAGLAVPSARDARRLAASLAGRGHQARASARLVLVGLPAEEAEAVAAAERMIAAAGDAPTVLAVGGPRTEGFDALLAGHDLVVVATSPSADPDLALLAAEAVPLPAHAIASCSLAPSGPARVLARAGVALTRSLRTGLRPAIEALR